MDYRFIPNNDPADEELIEELEANLGHELPEDYRQFLLTYNGPYHEPLDPEAHPDTSIGFEAQPSPPKKSEFWVINIFPSVSRAEGSYTIYDVYEAGQEWNHLKELLPIVKLRGNGRVFLAIGGPHKGKVFMAGDRWLTKYNEVAYDESIAINIDDYQKIADSFTDFISMIKLTPDDTFASTALPPETSPAQDKTKLKIISGLLILAFPLYAGFTHMSWLILPLLAISFTYAYVGQKWTLFKDSFKRDGMATLSKQLAITYVIQVCVVGVFYLLSFGLSALITDTPETHRVFDTPEIIVAGLSLLSVIIIGILNARTKI